MMMMLLLALVRLLHLIIILFVVFVPFTCNPYLLCIHCIFVPFLIIHWFTSDLCVLSLMESYLRDKPHHETFINSILIGPMFRISNRTVQYITYGLLLITIYKVYKYWDDIKVILYDFKKDVLYQFNSITQL